MRLRHAGYLYQKKASDFNGSIATVWYFRTESSDRLTLLNYNQPLSRYPTRDLLNDYDLEVKIGV